MLSECAGSVGVRVKFKEFFIKADLNETKWMLQLTSSEMICWHMDIKAETVKCPKQFSVPNLRNTGTEFSSTIFRVVVLPFPSYSVNDNNLLTKIYFPKKNI